MGLGMIGLLFIVAGEAAGLVEPTERAFDDPAFADELETPRVVAAADDVHVEFAEGTQSLDPCDQGTGIAPIGQMTCSLPKSR